MEELLRMEHISKRFGDFYANHDVNLSVAKGEVHTLLGENGAGKSTLMNILIGLYQPTEGLIFLNGRQVRIESPSQAVKLGIGMVHQHFMLVEAMTVFDNIILGDKHAKGVFIDRAARRREIEELFEGNFDYLNRVFSSLTGSPVFAYLNILRINNAKQLISTTDLPFSEIAYLVGIEDRYYFSKLFRKMTGMSPTEYYKEVRS